jgi:hypothetical protein
MSCDAPPNSLINSIASPKVKIVKDKELRHVLWLATLWGRGAYWSFKMGIRTSNEQVNYSHEPAQTKRQIG